MNGLSLLTADMRRAEKRGPKILIVGIPGVGKTSLLGTLAPETLGETLLVDAEAGDLAVAGLPIASVRPRTWPEFATSPPRSAAPIRRRRRTPPTRRPISTPSSPAPPWRS